MGKRDGWSFQNEQTASRKQQASPCPALGHHSAPFSENNLVLVVINVGLRVLGVIGPEKRG